ncbi:MAG: hypothetical protein WBO34_00380 [Gammaproteobacteria bacterium]
MTSRRLAFFTCRMVNLQYVLVAALLMPGIATAGGYIFAEGSGENIILHPSDYSGAGGTLTVRVCITPNTYHAAAMEIPIQNNINIYNALQPTVGNLVAGTANNIPPGQLDFESVSLHEIGHCLGMAHVNLASESGLTGADRDYTKSTTGGDGYDLNAGNDGIRGSSDDIRGNDINLHWFRKANNNPFTIDSTVDATTYSRNPADLPAGHTYAANGDRTVAGLLGVPDTEAVMQQGTASDEAQRTLVHDDVATLQLAASGVDEAAGTFDDYTINLVYGGISNSSSCDIRIAFDNAKTSVAVCEVSGSNIPGSPDHWRISAANIYFNYTMNWFFNTATVNQSPVLSAIGNRTVVEDASLSVPVSATDADGNNLVFTATGLPAFASLTDHGDGSATLDINPVNGDAGTYNVTIDVDDDGLPILGDSENFDIIVTTPVIDTDGDGVDDATEILNGTDPDKVDSDGDGLVDGAGGVVSLTMLPGGVDTDSDGFVDGETDFNTNPTNPDSDGDQLGDGLEVSLLSDPLNAGSWPNIADGDLAPLGSPDGNINAADLLIAVRIALGSISPLPLQFAHGDLYPSTPDGVIDLSDVLLLQQWVLGLP